MEKIKIGKIVNAVGLKGEVKVYNYSDSEEVYERTPEIYAGDRLLKVENVRMQKNMVILKLKGIDDIDTAETFRNRVLIVPREELGELPEGTYYICDLLGCEVFTVDGTLLGKIDDIIKTGSNDVYSVRSREGKQILIPVIDEVMRGVDIENKKITVEPLKGLID